jgi:RND family efflux transporter MFP subunit
VISSVMMGQVGGTLPAGAICTLVDLKTLEVVADVNEASIGQLREGQSAEVAVDAFPNQKWKGVLKQIIPTADSAKATVQVKVTIINPGDRLLPEMSSSVSFLQSERTDAEMREPARLWVPASALAAGNVAVVDAEKHVALRHVTTGAVREQRIEITSGIKSGDRIVTNGAEALKDGQLVRIE